jgi:signal transduction histidine kinase
MSFDQPTLVLFVLLLIVAQAVSFGMLLHERHKRRKSQSMAHRHYAEITHAARLALVGRITASIAHEVAQPLSAILNNIETALTLLQQPQPDLVLLKEILTDVRTDDLRANNIVRKLRGLLQKRELQFESVDVNTNVASVLSMVSAHANRLGVVVSTELEPDLPVVRADPVHLQQVLLNLVVNALEAMETTPKAARRLEIRSARYGNTHAQVVVVDSGRGIDARHVPKLFDSFFTTKKQGLGLGLSIARSIVTGHGGAIWAETAPHGGAAFFFTIPLLKINNQQIQPDMPAPMPRHPGERSGHRLHLH